MRIDSSGNLLVGTTSSNTKLRVDGNTQTDGFLSSGVYDLTREGGGNALIRRYFVSDSLNSGQSTRLTFSGEDRGSALIELSVSGSWTASTSSNNHPAAKYIFRVFTNSSGDASIQGPTALYEYVYSSASHFTFTNAGSFVYTIDITNPTGDDGVIFAYEVKILNSSSTRINILTASSTV